MLRTSVGLTYKLIFPNQSRLVTNVEFDYLLLGEQKTYLSDTHPLNSNFENEQHSGYGIRASSMYQLNNWSAGPYLTYWHIADSNKKYAVDELGSLLHIHEPKNNTVEIGLRISYSF